MGKEAVTGDQAREDSEVDLDKQGKTGFKRCLGVKIRLPSLMD